ncbi:hypothetical protein BDR07DRAFT_1378141 [Suillus spraguei]|nr:hypothetical protein BDR07DRAFT_1378141 [Suillus spraguei]
MWTWLTQSNAQRKFVELIFDRTGKYYLNWDPPSEITVGSFGLVDRATGNFFYRKVPSTPTISGHFSSVQIRASAGGENISITLLGSAPVVAPVGSAGAMAEVKWWSNTQAGLARNGCKTEHCFTPLYELLHVRLPRNRRATPSPERTGDQLLMCRLTEQGIRWVTPLLPWAPLNENGQEQDTDSGDSEEE